MVQKRCILCRRVFDVPNAQDPLPEHELPGATALRCNGSGKDGELLG